MVQQVLKNEPADTLSPPIFIKRETGRSAVTPALLEDSETDKPIVLDGYCDIAGHGIWRRSASRFKLLRNDLPLPRTSMPYVYDPVCNC